MDLFKVGGQRLSCSRWAMQDEVDHPPSISVIFGIHVQHFTFGLQLLNARLPSLSDRPLQLRMMRTVFFAQPRRRLEILG